MMIWQCEILIISIDFWQGNGRVINLKIVQTIEWPLLWRYNVPQRLQNIKLNKYQNQFFIQET